MKPDLLWRGIAYGLLLSVFLWMLILGMIVLAVR